MERRSRNTLIIITIIIIIIIVVVVVIIILSNPFVLVIFIGYVDLHHFTLLTLLQWS